MEFTGNELAILQSLYVSMRGNGFDFGFADDCRAEGKTARQCQGTLRQLHKKLSFWVDPEYNQVCVDWPDGGELPGVTTFDEWLTAFPRKKFVKWNGFNCEGIE